jgi:hypothetical protein
VQDTHIGQRMKDILMKYGRLANIEDDLEGDRDEH